MVELQAFGDQSGKAKAEELTRQAFALVERGNLSVAIDLLEQAIKIYPKCGDAYNELAFIYGRINADLDRAEDYARRAMECDASNPKFHNTINGIHVARARSLVTRKEIRRCMEQRLKEIQRIIETNPSYAPAYLSKAVALAFKGELRHIWEAELLRARESYLQAGTGASGEPLTPRMIEDIITQNRRECLQMYTHWENSFAQSVPPNLDPQTALYVEDVLDGAFFRSRVAATTWRMIVQSVRIAIIAVILLAMIWIFKRIF